MGTMHVLICEDDRAIRTLLGKILCRRGLDVESVATGADALERLRTGHYDLILLDLLTPEVTGYDVLEFLKRERPSLLDRVVVVTACHAAFSEPLPARVAAVLRKPFELGELDRVIDDISHPGPRDLSRAEEELRTFA